MKRAAGLNLFVSYAGPDRAWAEWAVWHLRAAGYSAELDAWDWSAGDNVVLRMNEALDKADRVVALWSPAYFELERFTTDEWTAVLARRPDDTGRRRLVPIRVAEVAPPPLLAPYVYRDVFDLDEDEATKVLLDAVRGPLTPDGRPQFPGTGRRKAPRGSAPRPPGVLPAVWHVPRRNAAFTGRTPQLNELRQQLTGGGSAVIQALHGFGGVGKTTMAIEYAHRFAGAYDLVWWVNAEQPTLIGEQFTALGVDAGWISPDAPTPNPAALVLQRLRVEGGWLLIFDNAESRPDLLPWLPQGSGHVLITSRNPSWDQTARRVALPEFTRAESIALLRTSLDLAEDRADQLAARLGDLPLALAQAGRTMSETGLTLEAYLELLDQQTVEILSDGAPVPLAAVVRTAMDRLESQDPAAADLLRLCAFLAPEPIPTDLFTGEFPSTLTLGRAIRTIGGFGLAKVGEGTLQLHRLTQAVLREGADPALRARVEQIMNRVELDDGIDPILWPRWSVMLPHILALDPGTTDDDRIRQLACHTSSYLISRGDILASRDFTERIYTSWIERFGPDDTFTMFAATNLAIVFQDMGRYVEGYELDLQTQERRSRIFGDDHVDTLTATGNLAGSLNKLERHEEALVLDQDTYRRRRALFGQDHRDTLLVAFGLACTLGFLGRYEEAVALHQDTFDRHRRTLGDDHPRTLLSAYNLGATLGDVGRHKESYEILNDYHARHRRILGEDHPYTLLSAEGLAVTLFELGHHAQAALLHEQTYSRRRRILGNDHPETLRSAARLAMAYRRIGKTFDAQQIEKGLRRKAG